jgi:hypothetical protein
VSQDKKQPGLNMPEIVVPQNRLVSVLIANFVLSNLGPTTPDAAKFYINLARLVDSAICDYGAARSAFEQFRSFRAFNTLMRGVSSLESAITCTHRALQFVSALRKLGIKDAAGEPLIPRPRDFLPSHDSVASNYKDMRDAIQHLDDRVASSSFRPSDVIMIEPTEDDFQLEGCTIRYSDWCRHLAELDAFVRKLSRVPTEQLRSALRDVESGT